MNKEQTIEELKHSKTVYSKPKKLLMAYRRY
jgi:hypothetical protein